LESPHLQRTQYRADSAFDLRHETHPGVWLQRDDHEPGPVVGATVEHVPLNSVSDRFDSNVADDVGAVRGDVDGEGEFDHSLSSVTCRIVAPAERAAAVRQQSQ